MAQYKCWTIIIIINISIFLVSPFCVFQVGVDDLQEEIEEFDEVQSVDIAAFNKI